MLSAPVAVDSALAKLHTALQSRLTMHEPLLRLAGRLQLLEAQRQLSHSHQQDVEAEPNHIFQGMFDKGFIDMKVCALTCYFV